MWPCFPTHSSTTFWAIYRGDAWESRVAKGYHVSPSIELIQTRGHTPQDITTLASTKEGTFAFTHLWWSADGPPEDPYALDREAFHESRRRVLELATLIVPGHGAPFRVTAATPR